MIESKSDKERYVDTGLRMWFRVGDRVAVMDGFWVSPGGPREALQGR